MGEATRPRIGSPPSGLDWPHWVDRWDRMQRCCLVRRAERFETIAGLVAATQAPPQRILDLGCGTGSLTVALLDALPQAQVIGVDFDPAVLWLAQARLAPFGGRAQFALADLRDCAWPSVAPGPFAAVVSATALHWLRPAELAGLYRQIARILRPGGILLNADHVGSDSRAVQRAWERHRDTMRAQEAEPESDDWDGFWAAYAQALGLASGEARERVLGGWKGGVEEGLPLAWHLDRLRACGFRTVDCFWRCDCDAIYGGILA